MKLPRAGAAALAWPYLAGLAFLVALPAAGALLLSFTEFNAIEPPRFSGLDNARRLVGDSAFWRSLGNSLVYVAVAVPLRLAIALGCALFLVRRSRAATATRAAVYLPSVVPDVAYALLWLWLLNPLYGPLAFGVDWFTDPWSARLALPLMSVLQIGEGFVVALAARRSIPSSLYEAAAVEGARPSFVLRRITLPMMAPILVLLAVRDAILALQMNFVPSLLVTEGGPRYATTYLSLYAYRAGFRYFRFGYASAISVSMFLITAAAIYLQYRLAKRWRLL